MIDSIFVVALGCILTGFLSWAFKHLPEERWQMLAVVPKIKNWGNDWQGTNLTYYGFFIATSQLLSLALLLILLGAMHVSIAGTMLIVLIILSVCIPAARLVAVNVEKKRHTFTIGGASCIGILIAPWVVQAVHSLMVDYGSFLPIIPVLAALSIAYTLGEGLGRLGCISFGCCYGKPVKKCHWLLQRLFARKNFIFHGATKKASYEGRLAGEMLIPIQAITCVIYTCGALVGTLLFLDGYFTKSLLLTIIVTQLWRIFSETLRADFRGFGKISAYQKMAILSVLYMVAVTLFIPAPHYIDPEVINGFKVLWDPVIILVMQILWLVFFLIFGRSTVTTSTVSFDLISKHV
ncbi:MAG: prolipoprotein diacylglyceryl transferase family protein [Pseudomonadota bacterium]